MSRIAGIIGVPKSTINREIKRSTGGRGYRSIQAQRLCDQQKQGRYKGLFSNTDLHLVEYLLAEEQWSLEQISLRLKEDDVLDTSHECIYQPIILDKQTGGDLHIHLRERTKRRKRYGSWKQRRGTIPNHQAVLPTANSSPKCSFAHSPNGSVLQSDPLDSHHS